MCKLLCGLASLGLLPVLMDHRAEACGDKLLAMSRGILSQRAYVAARSGSILIYASGAGAEKSVNDPAFKSSLVQAGHKVQSVVDGVELDRVLRSSRFDLLLADMAEAPGLSQRIASLESKPLLMPVLLKPSKLQLAAADKQFRFWIEVPSHDTRHLEAVDKAIKSAGKKAS